MKLTLCILALAAFIAPAYGASDPPAAGHVLSLDVSQSSRRPVLTGVLFLAGVTPGLRLPGSDPTALAL